MLELLAGIVVGLVLGVLAPRLADRLRWRKCWACMGDCFEAWRGSWHLSGEEMWHRLHSCIAGCAEEEGCG